MFSYVEANKNNNNILLHHITKKLGKRNNIIIVGDQRVMSSILIRGVVMILILEGHQASKIILEPFCLKYWGGANPTFSIG